MVIFHSSVSLPEGKYQEPENSLRIADCGFTSWSLVQVYDSVRDTVDGCKILHHHKDGWNPINSGIFFWDVYHLSTGAGFHWPIHRIIIVARSHHCRPAGRPSLDQRSWRVRIMKLPHQPPEKFHLAQKMGPWNSQKTSLNSETYEHWRTCHI